LLFIESFTELGLSWARRAKGRQAGGYSNRDTERRPRWTREKADLVPEEDASSKLRRRCQSS
jgi:hypothetical protein